METISNKASKQSWARLIQKVYEIDPMCRDARVSAKPGARAKRGSACGKGESRPLVCPKCGSKMSKMPLVKVIAVITDPFEVNKILECLKRNNA